MAAIRLVGIDVDGTLVGASGEVLPIVWAAAERARAAGIRLALASGRPGFGIALDYARRLDPGGWHIFQNGASVLHLDTSRSRSVAIPREVIHTLIAQARRTGHVLELYSDRDCAIESDGDWAREHARLLDIPFDPRPFETLKGDIVRAQWLVAPHDAQAVIENAPAHLEVAQSTSPIMPGVRFIGLTYQGVSKGSAIQSLAHEYGISLDEVMYVGDAGNDLSALRVVGVPVAMANADSAVLAAAKYVAGDVEEGGLVKALEIAIQSFP